MFHIFYNKKLHFSCNVVLLTTFATIPLTHVRKTWISTNVHNSVKLTTDHGVDVITRTDDGPDRQQHRHLR